MSKKYMKKVKKMLLNQMKKVEEYSEKCFNHFAE